MPVLRDNFETTPFPRNDRNKLDFQGTRLKDKDQLIFKIISMMFHERAVGHAGTGRQHMSVNKSGRIITCLAVLLLLVSETHSGSWLCPSRTCECPMNVSSTMGEMDQLSGLFRGLFNSETDLEIVLEQGYQVDKWNSVTALDKPSGCDGQTRGQGCEDVTVSLIDAEDADFGNSDCCCESKEFIIKPLTIQRDNKTYEVVHIPSAPQLISISTCTRLKKSCGLGRKCMALKGYTWILIYDVKLKYYPPVKFVPIKFPSGCACVV